MNVEFVSEVEAWVSWRKAPVDFGSHGLAIYRARAFVFHVIGKVGVYTWVR